MNYRDKEITYTQDELEHALEVVAHFACDGAIIDCENGMVCFTSDGHIGTGPNMIAPRLFALKQETLAARRLEKMAQWIAASYPISIKVVNRYLPVIESALNRGATEHEILSLVAAQISKDTGGTSVHADKDGNLVFDSAARGGAEA